MRVDASMSTLRYFGEIRKSQQKAYMHSVKMRGKYVKYANMKIPIVLVTGFSDFIEQVLDL